MTRVDREAAREAELRQRNDRVLGCFLGAALGDALGVAIEDTPWPQIKSLYGAEGITRLEPAFGRRGAITDATQTLLFTAEGILRYVTRATIHGKASVALPELMVWMAYRRWSHTQGQLIEGSDDKWGFGNPDGWLLTRGVLYKKRKPSRTTLAALRHAEMPETAANESKGNACVARSAPLGLFWLYHAPDLPVENAFALGRTCASLTHGHPVAHDAAGAFVVMIAAIAAGQTPAASARAAVQQIQQHGGQAAVIDHLDSAIGLAGNPVPVDDLPRKWRGYVAEEALAIATYSALSAPDFVSGVRRAVNHSGNSDATGAICGALLGAHFGARGLPQEWLELLEARGTIELLAADFARIVDRDRRPTRKDDARFPGQ